MNWAILHNKSSALALQAHDALLEMDPSRAEQLFASAAELEEEALYVLRPTEKGRTFGITAVSACALWYKARAYARAAQVAHKALSESTLPGFAGDQLRELLQTIWNEEAQVDAGLHFAKQQVVVSVKGGQILSGGAPLDLVVDKVQTIQSFFYRTVENLRQIPLRKKGPPTRDIKELCRPWLFHSAPGSYQFSVSIERPKQSDLFDAHEPDADLITSTFLSILGKTADDPQQGLDSVVPQKDYRVTFLKLARNLAPSGRVFQQLEVRATGQDYSIVLSPDSRKLLSQTLRSGSIGLPQEENYEEIQLEGILRAVHLDEDWLELSIKGDGVRIEGIGDAVDDVIGPMVNHQVTVHVISTGGRHKYRDIELDE